MDNSTVYQQIASRTKGDIYIGVVGPVRTGKSTFIKSFMESSVLPNIEDIYLKERATDELPQSGSGRTIMTSEPKFVPEEAVKIPIDENVYANVRLIDCVGYMVDGALGEYEEDTPRMVSTPWMEKEITLKEAAEIGTYKVISEHSTIGIVVTTDGTIGDIPRESYCDAEARVVSELKKIDKPFIIVLNSARPESETAKKLKADLENKYGVTVVCASCLKMGKNDVENIIKSVLYEFPVTEMAFEMPEWIAALPTDHEIRSSVYQTVREGAENIKKLSHVKAAVASLKNCEYIEDAGIGETNLSDGSVYIKLKTKKGLFFDVLKEQTGLEISNEADLLPVLSDLLKIEKEYRRFEGALNQVRATGYGIVMPTQEEMSFCEPQIVRQGGKFGVKLKAAAPSIHLIKADIETEISPIVGSEKQSEELVSYLMSEFKETPEKIWQSNIFGKSLSELVNEGLNNKLYKMPDDARIKFQGTLERIINEGSSGLICIIL